MLHRPMPPLSNGLPRRRCVLTDVGKQLAGGAKDDLADFLVEPRGALVEGDFAVDVAVGPELVAELEVSRVQISAGSGGHR